MSKNNKTKFWTFDELEAHFLNSDGPEYEQIIDAETFDDALKIAISFLKKAPVQIDVVCDFVGSVRENA